MLSRSHRSHFDQENAVTSTRPSGSHLHPTKTPARQTGLGGAGKHAAMTGGKGLTTTAKNKDRVLGNKDRNGARPVTDTHSQPGLLSAKKASTSTQPIAGPSYQPAQTAPIPASTIHSSPPPATVNPLPNHLRTPSPGMHKFVRMAFSPEVEPESEPQVEQIEPEEEFDQEVETAGKSARDYDEPFQPEFELPDFSQASQNLRKLPILPALDWRELEAQDEEERKAHKAELEIIQPSVEPVSDSDLPLFPVPKIPKPRLALATKSSNLTNSNRTAQPKIAAKLTPITATQTRFIRPAVSSRISSTSSRPISSSISDSSSVKRTVTKSASNVTAEKKADREAIQAMERELGIFGIVDEGFDVFRDGENSFERQDFRFGDLI